MNPPKIDDSIRRSVVYADRELYYKFTVWHNRGGDMPRFLRSHEREIDRILTRSLDK